MRILFYFRGFESVGIEYLSAVLKERGHQVGLLFDPGFDDNSYIKLPFLNALNRHGRMLRQAKEFQPDLIGFSCLTNLFPSISRILIFKSQSAYIERSVSGIISSLVLGFEPY